MTISRGAQRFLLFSMMYCPSRLFPAEKARYPLVPLLRFTSLVLVLGARPKRHAIAEMVSPCARPRLVSSRSADENRRYCVCCSYMDILYSYIPVALNYWLQDTKAGNNTCLTCRLFNVSRRIFYYWFNRFQEDNLRTLEDQDRAPKQVQQRKITSSQEQRIIFLRKTHIHWGKEKLAIIYLKTYQEKISCWKIQKTIEKYRLYPNPRRNQRIQSKRLRARRKKRITEFRKKPVLGYLVHFDTIVIYWNGLKRYIFTAIDEFTKIAFARMYASKSSSNARDFFYRVNCLLEVINQMKWEHPELIFIQSVNRLELVDSLLILIY